MKRLLTIIAMVALVAPVFGQLKTKSVSKEWETVKSYNYGSNELYLDKNDSTYFVGVKSDNQFAGYMYIYLGKTTEECLKTLEDLSGLFVMEKDKIIEIEAHKAMNETISLKQETFMGTKFLLCIQTHMAGAGHLYKMYINKMVKYFGGNPSGDEEPTE